MKIKIVTEREFDSSLFNDYIYYLRSLGIPIKEKEFKRDKKLVFKSPNAVTTYSIEED